MGWIKTGICLEKKKEKKEKKRGFWSTGGTTIVASLFGEGGQVEHGRDRPW
jgi:hypothetical protein